MESSEAVYIIGIAGASASGKTSISEALADQINKIKSNSAVAVSLDMFYKSTPSDVKASERNYDCPDAFDVDLLVSTLTRLKNGESVCIPNYDFTTHCVSSTTSQYIDTNYTKVVILEGIMTLALEIDYLLNLKIFIDSDLDVCLGRRIQRDITHRGRKLDDILQQYHKYVKPGYIDYVLPSRTHANYIITNTYHESVANILSGMQKKIISIAETCGLIE